MKLLNVSILKIAGCFALGIIAAHYFHASFSFLPVCGILLTILSCTWLYTRNQLFQYGFFGLIAFLTFFSLGYFNYQFRLPEFRPDHYSKQVSEEKTPLLLLKISEILKSDTYSHKYLAEIRSVDENRSTGTILLSIQKDSISKIYTIDDLLLISEIPLVIPDALNPYQFEYSKYMKTLEVHHQIRMKSQQIIRYDRGKTTLRGIAERSREYLLTKLKETALGIDERAIIQALVLGQKRDISKELQADYAAAGAIHILAVSGLHVGILYFILLVLLRPIQYLKFGKICTSIIIVILLWSFAFITGLSPSVTRAVLMFSLFSLATLYDRKTSPINTLVLSFFLLLAIRPNWLFHVGFQLSYLAVFSILWVQPKLYGSWIPKNIILKKFWSITTVTIAAQLGIIPLSLYYFHQFPGLFFITNIVVLPVLGLLLGGGILIVFLAAFDWLPQEVTLGFNFVIRLLNNFIGWIANQDTFLYSNIPFSMLKMLGSYVFIISIILLWKRFSYQNLVSAMTSVALLISIFIWDSYATTKTELVIFQKSRKTLLGVRENKNLYIFTSDTVSSINNYPIKSFLTASETTLISEAMIPSYFKFQNKKILIIDSLGVYPAIKNPDLIILSQSSRVHLDRLIDSLSPKQIVADGSNYNSYGARWKRSCQAKKIPFHDTSEKGAFILE